jgi:hypothetical protein
MFLSTTCPSNLRYALISATVSLPSVPSLYASRTLGVTAKRDAMVVLT